MLGLLEFDALFSLCMTAIYSSELKSKYVGVRQASINQRHYFDRFCSPKYSNEANAYC